MIQGLKRKAPPRPEKKAKVKTRLLEEPSQRKRLKKSMVRRTKEGRYEGVKPGIEVESYVVSQRLRPTFQGQTLPGARPRAGMPTSAQDYFLMSRAISYYAYDFEKETCEVGFTNGSAYLLYDFDEQWWINWRGAPSKGQYFVYQIRPHYNKSNVGAKKAPFKDYRRVR
jgi:hypothetical protein